MRTVKSNEIALSSLIPRDKSAGEIAVDKLLGAFVANGSELRKTVISGGDTAARNKAIFILMNILTDKNVPIFVLHNSNSELCRLFRCGCNGGFIPKNGNASIAFDPFVNISDENAISVLANFGSERMQLGYEFHTVLEIGFEIMRRCGTEKCLYSICDFPWANMADSVADNSRIDDTDKVALLQRIGAVADILPKVQALFSELKLRIKHNSESNGRICGIKDFINNKAVIFADIRSDGNELISELYLTALKSAKEMGARFYLVMDSVPVSDKTSAAKHFMGSKDTGASCLFASPDVCSIGEQEFKRLTGNGSNVILFSHSSGISADKWSAYFSEYYHYKINTTVSESRLNTAIITKTENRGTISTEERRRCIPPERIINLPPSYAIISLGEAGDSGKEYAEIRFD